MSLFQKFIATVYLLVSAGRWSDLQEYFALIREVLNTPVAEITVGKPQDKEI
jgi:hypothetical protein